VEKDMAYDPKKIHKVQHKGTFYKMNAYNHTHPSPQRTPVIFQAGASKAGIAFAAKHAEALFVHGSSAGQVRKQVDSVRQAANAMGRDGSKIKFFMAFLPIIGKTREEAQEKYERAKQFAHSEGGIATVGSFIGLDFSKYPLDEPFDYNAEKTEASIHGWIEMVKASTKQSSDGPWTPRKIGTMMGIGLPATSPVGTAEEVADHLERWVEEADVDGFNIQRKPKSPLFHCERESDHRIQRW
jgi:alkanesulfonate monooxygenase SsuD/methylene tetrahydromethanopterin reductase-like flavin-dependent oxidoreductase (luciferase family)